MGAERRSRVTPDGARGPRGHRQPSAVASGPPPGSAIRSSAARMSSPSAGRPEPGVLLPFRGSSSCVTRDPKASDSAKPPPKRPESPRERSSGCRGSMGLDGRHRVGQGPTNGRILRLRAGHGQSSRLAVRRGSSRPGRLPRRGYARPWPPRRSSGVGAPRRPPLPWRAGNAGVRGGAAPRQPPLGTHGVWPHGVRWLVSLSPFQASVWGTFDRTSQGTARNVALKGRLRQTSSALWSLGFRTSGSTAAPSLQRLGPPLHHPRHCAEPGRRGNVKPWSTGIREITLFARLHRSQAHIGVNQ